MRSGRELFGEALEGRGVDVGDEGIAEVAVTIEDAAKAAGSRGRSVYAAEFARADSGPGEAIGAKDEDGDEVEATLEEEDGRFAIDEVGDGAAREGKVVVTLEVEHRSKVEAPFEPRFDLVEATAFDFGGVRVVKDAEVVVDGLVDEEVGRAAIVPGDSQDADADSRSGRDSADEECAAS